MAIQAQLCTENIGGGGFLNNFQLADWNLLENHNNLLLCSTLHPIQQQQQLLLQQMQHQSLFGLATLDNNNNSSIQFQDQIDRFIQSQNERLRLMLQEQRKQQIVGLIKRVESKTSVLMKQKDEEIMKAARKRAELENLLKRLEMESQAWQRAAQENEAMVISLNNTLEEMRERASGCLNNHNDDAESCCEGNTIGGGQVDQKYERSSSSPSITMRCRNCDSRNSCVLFLPCRHLCACKACDAFLDSCPVCKMPKKASIEALIF